MDVTSLHLTCISINPELEQKVDDTRHISMHCELIVMNEDCVDDFFIVYSQLHKNIILFIHLSNHPQSPPKR